MHKKNNLVAIITCAAIAGIFSTRSAYGQSTELTNYVIFALESVSLKNPQSTGSIGVNEPGGKLSLGRGSFLADGTEVVGDLARVGRGSSLFDLFVNTLRGRFDPGIVRNTGPQHFTPPVIGILPPVADFLCGGPTITVKKGEGALLPPGIYGNVSFRNDSTVTLAGGAYTMCRLKIGKGVLVIAGDATVINLQRAMVISNGSFLGPVPGATRPQLNIAGGSLRFGKKTLVRAIIDARFARVALGNGLFEGRIIGRTVRSDFGLRLLLPKCGDGAVDDGEECDDGNDIDSDGCRSDCTKQPTGTPTPASTPAQTPEPTPTATPSPQSTPTPTPTPGPLCSISVSKTASPESLEEPGSGLCQGKIKSIELLYDGLGCSASSNQQGSKASCTGDASLTSPVRIIVEDKNGQLLLDITGVELGKTIVIAAGANAVLSSETRISILDGNSALLEHNIIHTSCSRPIGPGDSFGSFELIALDSTNGGMLSLQDNVTYTYEIMNLGNRPLLNVSVVDDRLGEIPGSPVTEIGVGGMVTLTATARITATTENQVLVTGLLAAGESCNASDSAVVTIVIAPESCPNGKKVSAISLRYTGEGCSAGNNAQGGKASCGCGSTNDHKQGSSDGEGSSTCDAGANFESPVWIVGRSGHSTVLDTFPVALGEEITAAASAGGMDVLKGDLRIDIINGDGLVVEDDVIHVSCSKPLAVGDRFGSFEVTELTLANKN